MSDIIPIPPGELAPSDLPLDRNPAAVYLVSLLPSGKRSQQQRLDTIAAILLGIYPDVKKNTCLLIPWWKLRYQHTSAIRAKLAEIYKAKAANTALTALRRVMEEAWNLGLMSADDYQHAIRLKPITGKALPVGREIVPLELAALMAMVEKDDTPLGARDAALLATLYPGGLRREEVVSLEMDNYNPQTHVLKVEGKRRKERDVPIVDAGAIRALAKWLAVRGDKPGPLFCAVRKNGSLSESRLKNQSVYDILTERAKQAGIEHVTPHDLRRTAATNLLDAGVDVLLVALYLGHDNVDTTRKYDKRGQKALQKAVKVLHLPYGDDPL